MKFRKTILLLFIANLLLFTLGCEKVSNYNKYEEHSLSFLVDLDKFEDSEKSTKINEVEKQLLDRLNKFNVKSINTERLDKNNDKYIKISFETNDEITDIKQVLSNNNPFEIKTPAEESEDYDAKIKENAKTALDSILNGSSFEITALNAILENPERVIFVNGDWLNKNEIKEVFIETAFSLNAGDTYNEVIEYTETPMFSDPVDVSVLLKLYDKREHETIIKSPRQVKVSHILVAYEGSLGETEIGRNKEEAKEIAEEVKTKLDNNEDFAVLAKEYSDDISNFNTGGVLNGPAGSGGYVAQFEEAALELQEVDELSKVVETQFGFHLIKADEIIAATEETLTTDQAKLGIIFFIHQPNEWEPTSINSDDIASTDLLFTQEYEPFVTVNLNAEGKKLYTSLTTENMGKLLAYFSGTELLMATTIKEVNDTGQIKLLKESSTSKADLQKIKLSLKPFVAPVLLIEE